MQRKCAKWMEVFLHGLVWNVMKDRAGSGVLKKEVRGQARIDEEELKENVRELKYLGSELHRGN